MAKSIYTTEYAVLLALLREARKASGLTQAETSIAMGRSQSFVSDVELGKTRLDVIQVREYCNIVGKPWLDLLKRFEAQIARDSDSMKPKSRRGA